VKIADSADDRRQVDDVRAVVDRLPRLDDVAQVARVDLARLAHPLGRLALVGHANLPLRVGDQAAHDGAADRPGAACYEDSRHASTGTRTRLKTSPAPVEFHGSTSSTSCGSRPSRSS
jgi:hypothetical protein